MVRLLSLSFVLALFAAPAYAEAALVEVSQVPANAGTVVRGAQRVAMMELELTASCDEDVVINGIRVHHRGLGDSADIARVYILKDALRITRTQSFNERDQSALLRFRAFKIPACESLSLTIAADFARDADFGGEHMLFLESTADIDAGTADVALGVARSANAVRTAPVSGGTISVTYPDLPGNSIRYGANRLVGRITLSADRESDHVIRAITFTNDGKAVDDDLRNIRLVLNDGTVLSSVRSMDGESIRFIIEEPLLLSKNQSRTFQIRADVRASRRQTVRLLIEEASDIEATARRGRSRP